MSIDQRGLATSGSPEAVSALDQAINHLVRFQVEVVEETAKAVAADPGCAMGSVLNAYLSLMSTEGSKVIEARDALRVGSSALAERQSIRTRTRLGSAMSPGFPSTASATSSARSASCASA